MLGQSGGVVLHRIETFGRKIRGTGIIELNKRELDWLPFITWHYLGWETKWARHGSRV